MSLSANFGSLSISSNLALSKKMVIHIRKSCTGSAFQALPDLEALEDVEVAVVLVSQLLVAVQSQQGLSLLKYIFWIIGDPDVSLLWVF